MAQFTGNARQTSSVTQIPEPPLARFLFADTRLAWVWLAIRLYVGFQWLQAGYEKVTSPVWFGAQAGSGLAGFAKGALQKSGGAHPDVTTWYAWFLQTLVLPHVTLWANAVAVGELLVGIGLMLGILTGVAGFFGTVMNANYLLAGTVSTNPFLFILGTWIVLGWRVAGMIGVDRYLLPALGTPWAPGKVARRAAPPKIAPQPAH